MSIRDFSESLTSNESHGYVCTLIYELKLLTLLKKATKMGIGTALGSAALGGLTGGVGGMVSGAIGGLGSLMGIGWRKEKKAREAEEREHQRQLEYMGLQAQYNKEQAKYSTELSKEMWDYTNYENQVKHLKTAGLNPALLYGNGGSGGSAAGGGSGYLKRGDVKNNRYKKNDTDESYRIS